MDKKLIGALDQISLTAQFVPVRVQIDTPEGRVWTKDFPPKTPTWPVVYVIRADGERIYAESGAPTPTAAALPGWMKTQLDQAGKFLPNPQLQRIHADWNAASKAYFDDDIAAAAKITERSAESGSFALPAARMDSFQKQLEDRARRALRRIEKSMTGGEEDSLDAAIELCTVKRTHPKADDLQKEIRRLTTGWRDYSAIATRLDQAELLDKAGMYVAKTPDRAVATYAELIEQFPDSLAAERAKQATSALQAEGASTTQTAARATANPAKARSRMGLAKRVLESNPSRARQYLQEALEAAEPGSDMEEEIRELLEGLEED